jgi:single-stranded DNA-specific DHH superfamily exonuclease
MTHYDVFNGDADGICALQQIRLQCPKDSTLITGLKRDISLLKKVDAKSGDEVTVLDISLDKNRPELVSLLEAGINVFYADHHFPGELPQHENLDSLIINKVLEGNQAMWAVVGAFGDNFDAVAVELGESINLNKEELVDYQQLGICLNYNGYGFELEDLMYHPADLFRLVNQYSNPADFIQNEPGYKALLAQYKTDIVLSRNAKAELENDTAALYILPNESWAKRIVGVMGNDMAKSNPDRAHALLVDMGDGHYRVSVRAPYSTKSGADELCRQFETGGGRKAAAGINRLPESLLGEFTHRFNLAFKKVA